jgi:F0F1-type ATP synthase assembly protein I
MTKRAADTTTKSTNGDAQFSLGTLGLDLLATTWRIMVPVLIFAGLGIFADIKLHTKPWLTIVCVIIGFIISGLLIKRLLAAVEKVEKEEDK